MNTEKYIRKPFPVEAVQVTAENINDVALWCKGNIEWTKPASASAGVTGQRRFIRVPVFQPKSEHQTFAFESSWVLRAGQGFKVYTHRTFMKDFEKVPDDLAPDELFIVETKDGPMQVINN